MNDEINVSFIDSFDVNATITDSYEINTTIEGTNINMDPNTYDPQGIASDAFDRSNHTGTQTASTISDFDTEVSNNTDVTANTSSRHNPVTVTNTDEIELTLIDQDIKADIKTGSVDVLKLDTGVQTSLNKADSAIQSSDLSDVATTGSYTDLINKPTLDDIDNGITYVKSHNDFTNTLKSKLDNIENEAEVNNISDVNATDLTDGGETNLHIHDDRYYTETEVNTLRQDISSGTVSTPSYTDNGDGTVTIGEGTYRLFSTTDFSGNIQTYTLAGNTFTLINEDTNYIVADYNSGTPVIKVILDVNDINESNIIPIYTIIRQGTDLCKVSWNEFGKGLANKLHQKNVKLRRFEKESGLSVGETGTRNVTTTAGIVWNGTKRASLDAVNTSQANNEICFFYKSSGVWTHSLITQYNNTQYDNGTDLQTLTNNRYTINWVFRNIDEDSNRLCIVLGTDDYLLAQAESATIPALPQSIIDGCILVGRIIVKKNSTTAEIIEQVTDVSFNTAGISTHNDLLDLQGGIANEYYHLTNAEHEIVSNTSGTNTGDQIASDFNHDDLSNITGTVGEYNHPTDSNMTVLNNTSGINTGDQDLSGLISKTTNITAINDTDIADGEITVFNLTNKDIRTSNKTFETAITDDDSKVPTSGAIVDYVTSLGGGDMLKTTYDPDNISADAFDMDNMKQGTTNKFITADIGISDNNLVEIDDTDVINGDYAKFTANGLQGRSSAEVKTDLDITVSDITDLTANATEINKLDNMDGTNVVSSDDTDEIIALTKSEYDALSSEEKAGKTFMTTDEIEDSVTLTDLNVTASATELNYCDGVTSNIQTQINNAKKYITATADIDGRFYINVNETLANNIIVNVSFPAATNNTKAAYLSIDGGTTYKIIKCQGVYTIGAQVESGKYTLVYDGTQWGFQQGTAITIYDKDITALTRTYASGIPGGSSFSYDFSNTNILRITNNRGLVFLADCQTNQLTGAISGHYLDVTDNFYQTYHTIDFGATRNQFKHLYTGYITKSATSLDLSATGGGFSVTTHTINPRNDSTSFSIIKVEVLC